MYFFKGFLREEYYTEFKYSSTKYMSTIKIELHLNTYFSEMVRIVHNHKGILDKFIGDGLMAVFGLEGDLAEAPTLAVRCASEMLNELDSIRRKVNFPLRIGIGIHCGPIVAVNIGSEDRLEYTVMGNAVNAAARLEEASKAARADLVISDVIYREMAPLIRRMPWRDMGKLQLRGRSEPLPSYSYSVQ